jgi:TusA-related sulfurtransferase
MGNDSVTPKTQALDIRNDPSPLSILKVRSALNNMKEGHVLEVWSNDLETRVALDQIIDRSNDEFLGIEKESEYEKIYIKRCKLTDVKDKGV